ncbi:hypothetical protein FRC01_010892, partial [Tulasnella sp. 417]
CEENRPGTECTAPLSVFAAGVEEVKRGLAEMSGPDSAQANVTAVPVTSDERDKKWWQTVADQGWHFVDYDKEDTVKTLGRCRDKRLDDEHDGRETSGDWNGGVATEVDWYAGQGAKRQRSEDASGDWVFED